MFRLVPYCVALSTALACELAVRVAAAAGPVPCEAPTLSVLLPDGQRWATATARLDAHLRGLNDLDRCAHVTVLPDVSGVSVRVTTGDGREAERHVESVDELLLTAEALLALPPQSKAHESNAATPTVPTSTAKPTKPEPTAAHVEVGIAGAVRLGGAPSYLGGGIAAFAGFSLDRWLLAMGARFDVTDAFLERRTTSDFHMQSTAVSVSAGRRMDLGQAALDALVGANVVVESQDADDGPREIHGAAGDFRLGVALRISGPRSGSIRPFAVGDFEGSPTRLRSKKYIERSLPNLPWWSSGLAIGILWGAR
jgi:hypothetical protein